MAWRTFGHDGRRFRYNQYINLRIQFVSLRDFQIVISRLEHPKSGPGKELLDILAQASSSGGSCPCSSITELRLHQAFDAYALFLSTICRLKNEGGLTDRDMTDWLYYFRQIDSTSETRRYLRIPEYEFNDLVEFLDKRG